MITTKEVQKMMSTDPKMKLDVKMKLDWVCIQEDGDMGTADALRHIQQKIKVCEAGQIEFPPTKYMLMFTFYPKFLLIFSRIFWFYKLYSLKCC